MGGLGDHGGGQAEGKGNDQFFFSSRRRHTRCSRDWSSDVCSSDLAEMTETLLEMIVAKQARTAIVDITGIDVMDTKTADHFIKMAKAVRLLGADCILSGINPGDRKSVV